MKTATRKWKKKKKKKKTEKKKKKKTSLISLTVSVDVKRNVY